MSFIYSMTDTWNVIGTTFNGIYMNISNGASGAPVGAAASRALRLDSNGTSIFSIDITGRAYVGDGTGALPSQSFGSDTGLGFFRRASNVMGWSSGGAQDLDIGSGFIRMTASGSLRWTAGADPTVASDLSLFRDAANVFAQRNGTNAQAFRVYNTYTDGSNYEYGGTAWVSSIFYLFNDGAAGTSTANKAMRLRSGGILQFGTNGTDRWQIGASDGHLTAVADNTYDIGASAATRPRNVYIAGFIRTAAVSLASLSASIATAVAAGIGGRAYITDGNVPVVFTTVAGGGTTPVTVYSDGTQWRAG